MKHKNSDKSSIENLVLHARNFVFSHVSSQKRRRGNKATTGKHNTEYRRRKTKEGMMSVFGLFKIEFRIIKKKCLRKSCRRCWDAFILFFKLNFFPYYSVTSFLDWLHSSLRHNWLTSDLRVVCCLHTQYPEINLDHIQYLQLLSSTILGNNYCFGFFCLFFKSTNLIPGISI